MLSFNQNQRTFSNFKNMHIKKNLILLYLLLVLPIILVACSQYGNRFKIQSKEIAIEFAKDFTCNIKWLPAGNNSIIAFDTDIQQGIVVDGERCLKFIVNGSKCSQKWITDTEFGTGLEAIITGTYSQDDLKIERQTRIFLPDQFPDVALFRSTYLNLGSKNIHIDSVFSQRVLLNRQLAEPSEQPFKFATFQGGINEWGADYALIWLTPGFRQDNFQGMHLTRKTHDPMGGGMPLIDIWGKTMGVAVAHLEKKPQWLSLPVQVRPNGTVDAGIVEKTDDKLGLQERLKPNDSFQTVLSAVIFHHLDFYDALQTYHALLGCRGINILKTSPKEAYEPYWKGWGFGFDFTLDMFYKVLPELKEMGINIANLDDGWSELYGDWDGSKAKGKFPNGDKDIIKFVDNLHKQGFKTNLWWYPLGVSPNSNLAKERPDLLVQAEDGSFPKDSRHVYQLCPAYKPSRDYIRDLVIKFTGKWGFDGLYTDTRGLAAVPPCFNKAHHHKSPLESFQEIPQAFKVVYETLQNYNKNAFQEVCICATAHSPYNMPYYQIASASDPVNLFQVRRRIKVEKAIHGPTFCVGDCYQVPKDEWKGYSVNQSFESAMGTGAQVTTFYKDLDSSQFQEWKKWIRKYRELELSTGEYLNLYDIAFDKPEIHVVKKGNSLFFGIFADSLSRNEPIQLRGLVRDIEYSVIDYANNKKLQNINGNNPVIQAEFKKDLLLQLTPLQK
jgi:alpha-galactosidase